MPDLTAQPATAAEQATGTDAADVTGDEGAQRAAQLARNISVREPSSSFVMEGEDGGEDDERKPLECQEDNAVVRDASSTFANAPGRTRTCDLRFRKPPEDTISAESDKSCDDTPANDSRFDSSQQQNRTADTDLAAVIEAWPTLPDALRAGILAMVEAVRASK